MGYGGMGYGGMGGMGMGGMGMGGMGIGPDVSLSQRMEAGTGATFQLLGSIVGAFGGFAQMLESTLSATHQSVCLFSLTHLSLEILSSLRRNTDF